MADIHLICPICATKNVFSEYSDEAARSCRSCGIAFSPPVTEPIPPSRSAKPALHVRDRAARKPPALPPTDSVGGMNLVPSAGRSSTMMNVRKEGGRSRWVALLSLLFFSALFVGAQVFLPRFPQWASYYFTGRMVLVALGLILIFAEAFRESIGQGVLCVILPFYVVYYGLTRVESYWRQGLTLAILVMVVAELHFLPGQAMISDLSVWVSGHVDGVGRLIQRAGDAPIQ